MRKQNSNYGSLLLGLIAVLVVIIPGIVSAQMWYDSDWGYRQAIDIDNSYNPNDLINYQVEVSLDSFNFIFTDAKPDGADVRFSDANSVMLFRYWIEEWDSIGETATIWVKVPVIPAISSTTIYMYYGNPDADDMSDGEETFEFFDDFEREYTGATGWTVKTPMPEKKADCTASVYNDQLYLFGGYDRDSLCVKSYLDDTYSYDPLTDNWAPLADMPTPRWGMVAVTFDTLIHLFSGEAETGATAAHEIYNPSTDMWTPGTDVPSVLGQQGIMGIKYGDKIHLFYKQYHYEYDPITDIYTPKTDVPTPRTWGTCALVSDKIYVIGGYSYGSPSDAIDVNEV
ncbi:MAG: DUF2341 domain-containing protein, partial [candidate division Zixibacteria bacterium]|nr:DUF2341 domain-containing protein [candidate division Zixibacteria bacterium]